MASARPLILRGLLVAAALALPVGWATSRGGSAATQSPSAAAEQAEGSLPLIGLTWGRVRGFVRAGTGWLVRWQPAHGAWTITAWVPDGPGGVRWRLDGASWLPGARLTRSAAETIAVGEHGVPQARERLGRRDWLVGETRLLGALPAGDGVPKSGMGLRSWLGLALASLLVGGAISRRLLPALVDRFWARALTAGLLVLVGFSLSVTRLGFDLFAAEVRPWVTELALLACLWLALAALSLAAYRVPAAAGAVGPWSLVIAHAAGMLVGAWRPAVWVVAVAGLEWGFVLFPVLALILGWAAGLAAETSWGMFGTGRWGRVAVAGALIALALVETGPLTGVATAVVAASITGRIAATPVAVSTMWGWLGGVGLSGCHWPEAAAGIVVFVLAGAALVSHRAVRNDRGVGHSLGTGVVGDELAPGIDATIRG